MEGPLHPLSHKEEIVKLLPQIKRQLKNRGNRGKTGETGDQSQCNILRKSMMRRPSQNRPAGLLKKICPLGGSRRSPIPATRPPVSEFESPKLKTAGKLNCMECARGEKMKMKARIWRMKDLEAMAVVAEELAAFTCNFNYQTNHPQAFYKLK